jgi:glycosyltransferase involved in cell wall biosynthesis
LNQDYPHLEYLVLDDGSTDNTAEVLGKYADRIIVESHTNMGETKTVNKGFSMAQGDLVCVVNSDDPIMPGLISAAVEAIQTNPDALIVYPDWQEIGPHSEPLKEYRLPNYNLTNMLLAFKVSMGPGTFIRRRVFELVGYRNPNLRYTGDLDFWFRTALHGQFIHIPQILATHRVHPDSASVSQQSSSMAHELVSMAASILADDLLPDELRKRRSEILRVVYLVATGFCGLDRLAMLKYFMKSCYHTLDLKHNVALLVDYPSSRQEIVKQLQFSRKFLRTFWNKLWNSSHLS